MTTYEEKKQKLYEKMRDYLREDVCLAFSGGVDSSLLLILAANCVKEQNRKVNLYAVTFDTKLHPSCDLETARNVAREAEVFHEVLFVNELEQEAIRFNPKNRCYLCKKTLFSKLQEFAKSKGVSVILEGTNEDDLHVYRPGLQAIQELGIKSPLAETGFTKEEVRKLAKELGVSVAERPSTPCLATRLPYGTEISMEVLERIAKGEEYLHNLGFSVVRLRVHGEIARIEVPKEDFWDLLKKKEEIIVELKKLGFPYVTLDLEGFRSGSMDEKFLKVSRKNT